MPEKSFDFSPVHPGNSVAGRGILSYTPIEEAHRPTQTQINRRTSMKMENRNQYNSPRDRIDDALLIRLLNEEEPLPEYSCTGERRSRTNPGCGGTMPNRRNRCRSDAGNCSMARQENGGCTDSCMTGGCLSGYPLAMVYMPDHDFDGLFDEEEALSHGTLFIPLELPFYPGKCSGNCGCRDGGSR